MILAIIKEETGIINPKRLQKGFRKRERKMQALTQVVRGGIEKSRLQKLQENNIYAYASILSMSRDDVGYLDKQLRLVEDVNSNNSLKIKLAYKHMIADTDMGESTDGMISLDDAKWLLRLIQHPLTLISDFEHNDVGFLATEFHEITSVGVDSDDIQVEHIGVMPFVLWLHNLEKIERIRILTGLMAEKSGCIPKSFLQYQYVRWKHLNPDGTEVVEEEAVADMDKMDTGEDSPQKISNNTVFPSIANTLTLLDFMTAELQFNQSLSGFLYVFLGNLKLANILLKLRLKSILL